MPAANPGSRVPLKCGDLFTTTAIATLVGAPVKVARDETTPPAYIGEVANDQLGVLGCHWAGGEPMEFGNTADVTVYIAPNSSEGFAANYSKDLADVPAKAQKPVENTAGDKSGYWCEASGLSDGVPLCTAQMLVGSYWVTASLSALAPATASSAGAGLQKVLDTIADRLSAAAQPVPAWVAPATTPPAFCTAPSSTAEVRSIFGAPGYAVSPEGTRYLDASSIAFDGPGASCSWVDSRDKVGSLNVDLLASGSWVFPGFAPHPAIDGVVQSYSSATIPGANYALLGCDEGLCEAYLAIGTTLAHINMNDLGTAKNVTALAALAKDIAAS